MAHPKLKRIEVENFKSIRSDQVDISDNSIFIGKNNSGKSNVIDVFKTIQTVRKGQTTRSLSSTWYKKRVTDQDTSKSIKLGIVYEFSEEKREELVEEADPRKRKWRKAIQSIKEGNDLTEIKLEYVIDGRTNRTWNREFYARMNDQWRPADDLRKKRIFPNENETKEEIIESISTWTFVSPFRSPNNSATAKFTTELDSDGSNLIPILHSLQTNNPDRFNSLCNTFIEIMEGVERLSVNFTEEGTRDLTVKIEEMGLENPLEFEDISSGTKEILVLLAQMYNAAEQADILFLEEPELHLHPGAEQDLYQAISDISGEHTGIIISTHSNIFVNKSDASSIIRVTKEPYTSLRGIRPNELDIELQDLGYDKSSLLQSEVVVFVEGLSDKRILREFAKTAAVDPTDHGVEFVELDDVNTMKRDAKSLVKLLSAFDIPHIFVVDHHGKPTEEVRGELYDEMKRDDGDGWWEASLENIFVWDAYGIESYLLDPEAISEGIGMSKERIQAIIEENKGVDDKAEVLAKIYAEEYSDHEDPRDMYDKARDGMQIAKRIRKENLPRDIEEFIEEVSNRIDTDNGTETH